MLPPLEESTLAVTTSRGSKSLPILLTKSLAIQEPMQIPIDKEIEFKTHEMKTEVFDMDPVADNQSLALKISPNGKINSVTLYSVTLYLFLIFCMLYIYMFMIVALWFNDEML